MWCAVGVALPYLLPWLQSSIDELALTSPGHWEPWPWLCTGWRQTVWRETSCRSSGKRPPLSLCSRDNSCKVNVTGGVTHREVNKTLTSSGRTFPQQPPGWTAWWDCSWGWSTPARTPSRSFPQEMTWTPLGPRGLEDNQCEILIEWCLCLLNGNNGGQANFSRQSMFSSDFLVKWRYFPNFLKV